MNGQTQLPAAAGVPALAGFGPIGQGDCTRRELIVLASLFERIKMAVRLLLNLGEDDFDT